MEALEQSLAASGLFVSQDLTDLDLGIDTWIRFTLEPPPAIGKIIKPEQALAYHLSRYPEILSNAVPDLGRLRLRIGGQAGEREYPLGDKMVRPDLVFSTAAGRWLVCELESGDPKRESVPQLEEYANAIAINHKSVVALLVTGIPRKRLDQRATAARLRRLADAGLDVRWATYDVNVVASMVDISR